MYKACFECKMSQLVRIFTSVQRFKCKCPLELKEWTHFISALLLPHRFYCSSVLFQFFLLLRISFWKNLYPRSIYIRFWAVAYCTSNGFHHWMRLTQAYLCDLSVPHKSDGKRWPYIRRSWSPLAWLYDLSWFPVSTPLQHRLWW